MGIGVVLIVFVGRKLNSLGITGSNFVKLTIEIGSKGSDGCLIACGCVSINGGRVETGFRIGFVGNIGGKIVGDDGVFGRVNENGKAFRIGGIRSGTVAGGGGMNVEPSPGDKFEGF